MQNYKKGQKNQREQEETGLFPPFLQMESHKKRKRSYIFCQIKSMKNEQSIFCVQKNGKTSKFKGGVSKREKKGEFLKKMGQRTKKNRTDKSGFFFSCLFCCQYIKLLSFLQC